MSFAPFLWGATRAAFLLTVKADSLPGYGGEARPVLLGNYIHDYLG